jgi:cytochrome c oxidase subunit 2
VATDRETTPEPTGAVAPRAARQGKAQLVQMLTIGLIASIGGVALGLIIDWFPPQASEQSKDIDTLWDILIIASVPVFVLVEVVVLYSVWKFRMRPGEEQEDGPPIHGNTLLEIIWTAIPAILMVGLSTYSYIVLTDIEEAKANEMRVRVVGEQFTWTFFYPGGQGQREIASSQLYLPENTPVRFDVQSKDVIHDFWVPAFRLKIDAVPGITTNFRITTTDRKGNYPVVCAELCGLGHSVMRQTAHIVTRDRFDDWLAQRRRGRQGGGGGGGGGEQADAKGVFAQQCGTCHTLADANARGTVGPNLDNTLKGRDEAYIRQSIVEPDAEVARGFQRGVMPPNFGDTLSEGELNGLVDYLVRVTR